MDRYALGAIIGQGQFGHVRTATVRSTGAPVAIKFIHVSHPEDGLPHPVARELVIAAQVQHETLVRTYEVVVVDDSHVGIVMELCDSDIDALLRTHHHTARQPMRVCTVRGVMRQLLTALHVLHRDGILHRDVKPSNCFLSSGGVLKLGDFGLSRRIAHSSTVEGKAPPEREHTQAQPPSALSANERQSSLGELGMTHEIASRCYRAPELLLGLPHYGPEVDVWSAGCVMAELLRGVSGPFFCGTGGGDIGQLSAIFAILGTPTTASCYPDPRRRPPDWERVQFVPRAGVSLRSCLPEASPTARHLLRCMLALNPQKRPSAAMALQHPFFQQ